MRIEHKERNERIFEAVIRGETWLSASRSAGISHERAHQIVHKMRRMMMQPKRLGSDIVPEGDYFDVFVLRENAEFWLTQLAKWRAQNAKDAHKAG